MNNAEKAILKAMINGVLTELLVKTSAEQVYLDATTTLATKLTEMIAAINERAKTTDVNNAIAEMKTEIKQELLGDMPVEAMDTLTEVAKVFAEHEDVADALQAAIGDKADKSTVESLSETIQELGALAKKSTVSESDLDSALREKVNAASEGNHSHNNKSVLDGIDSTDVSNWDAASQSKHSHTNKSVLDGIDSTDVSNWDAAHQAAHSHANKSVIDSIKAADVNSWNAKTKVYVASSQPSEMTASDFFVQLV